MAPGNHSVTMRAVSPRTEPTHGEGIAQRNTEKQGPNPLCLGPRSLPEAQSEDEVNPFIWTTVL